MTITLKLAQLEDVPILTELRLEMRKERETATLSIPMEEFQTLTERFFHETLVDGSFLSVLAFDGTQPVACSGLSLQRVPPSYSNPSGWRGYITNMYTRPQWRRKGIAKLLLDALVQEAHKHGCPFLYLNASAAGRPVYEKYGFQDDKGEMMLDIRSL